jgi:hypothetical protein
MMSMSMNPPISTHLKAARGETKRLKTLEGRNNEEGRSSTPIPVARLVSSNEPFSGAEKKKGRGTRAFNSFIKSLANFGPM